METPVAHHWKSTVDPYAIKSMSVWTVAVVATIYCSLWKSMTNQALFILTGSQPSSPLLCNTAVMIHFHLAGNGSAAHVHTHTHIHTYIHAYTHIHTYMHT